MLISRKSSYPGWRHPTWEVIILFAVCLVSCTSEQRQTPLDPGPDPGPTSVVSNLKVVAVTADRVTISWTAPPHRAEVLHYEIRHSEESLTVSNWSAGVNCRNLPPLADSGETQSYDVTGATAGRLSYIAIRIRDANDLYGPISTNVSATLPSLLTLPVSYYFGGNGIATSDFDSDGDMDIVIINETFAGDNLYTLSNDGAGRFTQNQALSVNGSLLAVRTGDFNNDGFTDLATLSSGRTYLLTNNGTGLLSVTDSLSILPIPSAMQAGDFNRDGFTDIITGSSIWGGKFGGGYGLLAVYFNDGSGGFVDEDTVNTITGVASICVFDADDDGDIDLAITYSNSTMIELHYNDGTGRSWDNRQSIDIGRSSVPVTSGDLNNDGKRDLIGAGGYYYESRIIAAIRNDQGGYSLNISPPGDGRGTDIHLGDFDGDGFLDVARADSTLTLHLNDGQGGFAGLARYPAGSGAYQLALEVADFNGDGHPDIGVLQHAGELFIFLSSL